jgi:hypothetical protein
MAPYAIPLQHGGLHCNDQGELCQDVAACTVTAVEWGNDVRMTASDHRTS